MNNFVFEILFVALQLNFDNFFLNTFHLIVANTSTNITEIKNENYEGQTSPSRAVQMDMTKIKIVSDNMFLKYY